MNDFLRIIVPLIIGMIIGIFIILDYKEDTLDLPENYKQISQDHYKPDTLLGFYIDNKLHIEFKSK